MLMKADPDLRIPRLSELQAEVAAPAPVRNKLSGPWAAAIVLAVFALDTFMIETTPDEMLDLAAPLWAEALGWVGFGLFLAVLVGAATRRLWTTSALGGFVALAALLHASCSWDGHVSMQDSFYANQTYAMGAMGLFTVAAMVARTRGTRATETTPSLSLER